ncbi:response regulator receiver sensor signal transduction histidine kinase [Stanieria cyanosphaera PCC 7437]|uniref:histidine kinase n=1 Tax=Stanieria cyanosphaera (strain ATCC 29371 / PCC 7437) TaxID=111780 RepID=K9XR88_STAC7|nr:hybrid sensor histidine kinase/response regulator [Stanieria cyanosphaera]AFZ34192.1 response regulator receiver sensor signal transduction histidine kinase [Stanieria cyanosphaera PCC 7437]
MSVTIGEFSKILIITNDIKIRHNLEQVLSQFYELFWADEEKSALELIKSDCPNLIILALTNTEINNICLFTQLRNKPETALISVIVLTTIANPRQWRTAMEMGADDVLFLPCTDTELHKAIATRLTKQTCYLAYTQQELDQLRENIIKFLPHEMRTALTGILSASDLLINQQYSLNWSIIREMLICINSSSQRLLRLIDNFLLYAELKVIENNPDITQLYCLHQIDSVKEKIKAIAHKSAQKYYRQDSLIIDLQNACLQINETNLTKLIEELIDNACKFSPEHSAIHINSQIDKNQFILTIKDYGRGMTHKQIASIDMGIQFERNYYEQQGFGLGLAIVRQIAQIYKVKLEIKSIPKQTTIVKLVIPLADCSKNSTYSKITHISNWYSTQTININYSF